jgi:hypothetical protein
MPCVVRSAQSDGHQRYTFGAELLFHFAQLRDMPSAEDSTIMP